MFDLFHVVKLIDDFRIRDNWQQFFSFSDNEELLFELYQFHDLLFVHYFLHLRDLVVDASGSSGSGLWRDESFTLGG